MTHRFTGAARVAGVVGSPVRQSLSPLIHNAWIETLGLDAVYVPFSPAGNGFRRLVNGTRGSGLVGLNITLPFKTEALALADFADDAAKACGAANLLLFHEDGGVEARNTDGAGLLYAFREQAPAWRPTDGPVVVLGAGGAARGGAAALAAAGAQVRVVNRTHARALELAESLPGVVAVAPDALRIALGDCTAVVNATAAGLEDEGGLAIPWDAVPAGAVAMDMVYKPLHTAFLRQAKTAGHVVVDGLAMLIGQAIPSFEALFGCPPPTDLDVRALALAALGEAAA